MKNILAVLILLLIAPAILNAQEEVKLNTFTGTIYGTLQVPKTDQPVAVVMIIAGSGPTDRNGNNPQMQNNCLKMLADSLEMHGIGSLRYDKRGIAASKEAGIEESDLRFENYVDDAVAWVRLLKKDARFSKVIIAGHSEGSLIGMIAAAKEHIDGYISLAGAGNSADIILKEQLSAQPEAIRKSCYSAIDSLYNGKTVSNISPQLFSLFRPSVQPYLISWFKYNPQKEIKKLSIPILILQGSTDLQISEDDARLLSDAAPGSKLSIITGMNHILKNSGEDRQENIATYSDPTLPLNASLVKEIVSFLNSFR
ncbi:MAG: alpha/beta hydrolase [Bacteroidetes bacterium]|nr:alpha/beta hydrolase [Bacteroidota bacterium]